MSTVEQQGELPRLEAEMREHIPEQLCDTLVSVLDLATQRDEHKATANDAADALSRTHQGENFGRTAEQVIDAGLVPRHVMKQVASIAVDFKDAHLKGMTAKPEAREKWRHLSAKFVKRCREHGTTLLPDHGQLKTQLDESLESAQRLVEEDSFCSVGKLYGVQENAPLLQMLVGADALAYVDSVSENLPEPDVEELIKIFSFGFSTGSSDVVVEHLNRIFSDPERVDAVFQRYQSFYELSMEVLPQYDRDFYKLGLAHIMKLKETVSSMESAHATLTDSIVHILLHVPTALREGIKTDEETEYEFERLVGVLCVENWVETAYLQLGMKVTRVEAKPLHVLLESAEDQKRLTELKEALDPLYARVAEIDKDHAVTGSSLRKLGGLPLRTRLEHYTEPGSNLSLFDSDSAQQLVGLALVVHEQAKGVQLANDVSELRKLWADIAFLSPKAKREGLIRDIDTLMEWHESASQKLLNDRELTPIWELAKLLKQEHNTVSTGESTEDPVPPGLTEETEEPSDTLPPAPRQNWRIPEEFSHIERVEAFPPGITGEMIVEDLTRISKDYEGDPVDWERIHSLIDLRHDLELDGFMVKTHRLLQSEWHPLPHYVLEIRTSDGCTAVVESPIYGNATYVIPDADWREIVRFSKEDVRKDWGGIAKVHAPNRSSGEHRAKLRDTVIAHAKSNAA